MASYPFPGLQCDKTHQDSFITRVTTLIKKTGGPLGSVICEDRHVYIFWERNVLIFSKTTSGSIIIVWQDFNEETFCPEIYCINPTAQGNQL